MGIGFQQLLPCGQRALAVLLALPLNQTEIEQRIRILWIVAQRLVQLVDRVIDCAHPEQARRQLRPDCHIARLGCSRSIVVRGRLLVLVSAVIDPACLHQQIGIFRIGLQLFHQRRRLLVGHRLHLFQLVIGRMTIARLAESASLRQVSDGQSRHQAQCCHQVDVPHLYPSACWRRHRFNASHAASPWNIFIAPAQYCQCLVARARLFAPLLVGVMSIPVKNHDPTTCDGISVRIGTTILIMCDVAHDAIFRSALYCDFSFYHVRRSSSAGGHGLVSSGPAIVGTLCRQPGANSSQIRPLPSGNGMFREPVPLKDWVEVETRKPDAQFSPAVEGSNCGVSVYEADSLFLS